MPSDDQQLAISSSEHADASAQAELHARGSTHADATAPRVVTTGGKNAQGQKSESGSDGPYDVDLDTGERVEIYATGGRGVSVTRHLTVQETAPPSAAQVDAVAFSLIPPAERDQRWLVSEMSRFMPIDGIEQRGGCFGFKNSAHFGDGAGLYAWGGKSQRGRIYFSIQGKGCSLVSDWNALKAWLETARATLKRVDVAHDDFAGEAVTIAWAVDQYKGDGFTHCGRRPSHQVHGDWLSGEASTSGRTFCVGKRKNGKHCRVYEKGKQLGDPTSPWVRLEVEWHGKDRVIPLDILTSPGKYLAGAYPCVAGLNAEQSRIKTIAHAASTEFDAIVKNAKRQSGPTIDLLLHVFGGDIGEVVARLRRKGSPARLKLYSYQLAGQPELLDPSLPDGFASIANRKP